MSFRRRQTSPFGSPILIGALTVLVTIVAVTLAYNANNGLPFVPRYTMHLQIADASEVTKNAEVHMGGALIGAVTSVAPEPNSAGAPIAVMNLSLNKNVEPLPVDHLFRKLDQHGDHAASRLRHRGGLPRPLRPDGRGHRRLVQGRAEAAAGVAIRECSRHPQDDGLDLVIAR